MKPFSWLWNFLQCFSAPLMGNCISDPLNRHLELEKWRLSVALEFSRCPFLEATGKNKLDHVDAWNWPTHLVLLMKCQKCFRSTLIVINTGYVIARLNAVNRYIWAVCWLNNTCNKWCCVIWNSAYPNSFFVNRFEAVILSCPWSCATIFKSFFLPRFPVL